MRYRCICLRGNTELRGRTPLRGRTAAPLGLHRFDTYIQNVRKYIAWIRLYQYHIYIQNIHEECGIRQGKTQVLARQNASFPAYPTRTRWHTRIRHTLHILHQYLNGFQYIPFDSRLWVKFDFCSRSSKQATRVRAV